MRAQLLYLHSPDVRDLRTWAPERDSAFCILVQAMVSPEDSDGEESFDFLVCNAEWLKREVQREEVMFLRFYLAFEEYSFQRLERAIQNLVQSINGDSWMDVALKLGRFGKWEFEDYRR